MNPRQWNPIFLVDDHCICQSPKPISSLPLPSMKPSNRIMVYHTMSPVTSSVLAIPQLLRQIPEYSTPKENSSIVLASKLWSDEAVSVLQRRVCSLRPLLSFFGSLEIGDVLMLENGE